MAGNEYDLIVIGAGGAANMRKHVALIERDKPGGHLSKPWLRPNQNTFTQSSFKFPCPACFQPGADFFTCQGRMNKGTIARAPDT